MAQSLIVVAFIFAAVVIGVRYLLNRSLRRQKRDVPGPRGLPLVGNLFDMRLLTLHVQLSEWAKVYGPVLKFSVPGLSVVVLSSKQAVVDAFVTQRDHFSGRPSMYRVQRLTNGKDIISQNYTATTARLKQLVSTSVHAYGTGMDRLETFISELIAEFIDSIHEKSISPMNITEETKKFICVMMATMIFGEKPYSYEDPLVRQLADLNDATLEALDFYSSSWILDLAPWLRHFGIPPGGLKAIEKAEFLKRTVLESKVKKARQEDSEKNSESQGILHDLIKATRKDGSSRPRPDVTIDDEHIVMACLNLVGAGVLTTTTTMSGAYRILAKRPDVQQRIFDEITSVAGGARPTLVHRQKMPYCQAFVEELLRYVSTTPLLVPHVATQDTTILDYSVPKDTLVIVNGWGIHHDEAVYERPFDFIPERFLDGDGNLRSITDPVRANAIPFGLGRRVCVGENLARIRIFLLITALVRDFRLMEDNAHPLTNLDTRKLECSTAIIMPECWLRFVPRDRRFD